MLQADLGEQYVMRTLTMRHAIASGKPSSLPKMATLLSLLLAACQASGPKEVEQDASRPPDSPPDSKSEQPLVACGSGPVTGDRCDPLPTGILCRQGTMCGGGCAIECSCVGGRWACEGPVCRDYFVNVDGGMAVASCGTPPLCQIVCGYPAPANDGGMDHPENDDGAVAETKGLWACLVRWRSCDRWPGRPAQEAKTAGSRREPKPLPASFASQGRRMHVRVGKRGGWQGMIGAAAADSPYASAASGGSP